MGDSVDNIPGLPGVGPKTAVKLIEEFDNLENVLANADKMKGKLQETVQTKADLARLSKTLATIHIDAPVDFDYNHYEVNEFNNDVLLEVFKELEFKTLAATILSYNSKTVGKSTSTTKAASTKTRFRSISRVPFDNKDTVDEKETLSEELSNAQFNITNTPHEYKLVATDDDWNALRTEITGRKFFCFDTETTSLDPIVAELVGISISTEAHKAWYISVPEDQQVAQVIANQLKPLWKPRN